MSVSSPKNAEKLTYFFAAPASEVFSELIDGRPRIGGYAARFGSFSEDRGGYVAKIAPGFFDRAIRSSADTRLLVNHDPNLIMGRTKSGTLRLASDAVGLRFEGDLPDTPLALHYAEAIRRGDMSGCSFTCTIEIDQWDWSGETPVRTLQQIGELYDVGPVTFPAFSDTNVSAHSSSLEGARAAIEEQREACARRARRARLQYQRVCLGL